MRLSVVTCGGRELAALDAEPSWRLSDVLARVPEQERAADSRRRIFLEDAELRGGTTQEEIGAACGSLLTLVVTPAPLVVTASTDGTANVRSAASGE